MASSLRREANGTLDLRLRRTQYSGHGKSPSHGHARRRTTMSAPSARVQPCGFLPQRTAGGEARGTPAVQDRTVIGALPFTGGGYNIATHTPCSAWSTGCHHHAPVHGRNQPQAGSLTPRSLPNTARLPNVLSAPHNASKQAGPMIPDHHHQQMQTLPCERIGTT